ncbi:uncharacterized protein [Bemisia tabaci]|uniref:uncharacterized protein isoform X4 n=1 Tax=Bemisia tabaci TaxID=7038 RepID=UPI003B28BBFB
MIKESYAYILPCLKYVHGESKMSLSSQTYQLPKIEDKYREFRIRKNRELARSREQDDGSD